jgi:hypothetical protein
MLSYVRAAIIANGGSSASYRLVDAWRQLVTAYGGTPTLYTVIGLMRQAIVAVGGTPTQFTELGLLRELLTALGVTPAGYKIKDLYAQLATAVFGVPVDSTPNAFSFTDVTDATASTVYTSNTITVAGLGSGVSTTVSVADGLFSKNGAGFTTGSGLATNGDTFAVRHTSSASNSTATSTTLTIGGVSDTFTTTTEAAAGSLIAPVLAWTSGTSAYDPTFSLTEIIESDVVELQIDDVNTFTSLFDSDTNTIDAGEAASGSLTFAGISSLTAGTTFYARARYQRGGVWSDWSNTVSKAMDAVPLVKWTSTNGANKYASIALSNGNLTATPTTDSGYEGVEATAAAGPAKYQFECTLASIYGSANSFVVGVSAGTADFSVINTLPGNSDGTGTCLQCHSSTWYLATNGSINNFGAATVAPGGVITVAADEDAGTVKFFYDGVQIGTTQTGLSMSNWFAFTAGNGGLGAVTGNFTGPFAYPQTGYSSYE